MNPTHLMIMEQDGVLPSIDPPKLSLESFESFFQREELWNSEKPGKRRIRYIHLMTSYIEGFL